MSVYTAGSSTLLAYFNPMRKAGAQARKLLIRDAAHEWGVPVSTLKTEPSRVVHPASGRELSYGKIVNLVKTTDDIPKVSEADFKKPEHYRYLGKDVPRLDAVPKTTGTAEYGIDVQVPGMVYASVLRAPVEGENPLSVDAKAARKVEGVIDVVEMPWGVAVVANTYEAALWGRQGLEVDWSETSRFRQAGTEIFLDESLEKVKDLKVKADFAFGERGDIDNGICKRKQGY